MLQKCLDWREVRETYGLGCHISEFLILRLCFDWRVLDVFHIVGYISNKLIINVYSLVPASFLIIIYLVLRCDEPLKSWVGMKHSIEMIDLIDKSTEFLFADAVQNAGHGEEDCEAAKAPEAARARAPSCQNKAEGQAHCCGLPPD